ncbi:prolyl oligopeptidase family serine peptidase [Simiduia agarivorans]|uniref:Prolyl oligopeptidase family protein n=1 Tax=Simiduia agarivorans (strain DSM 21679 / JCM 13881 / BCRC 17597 / SA1) TaxID=1117647 RepID=K4KJ46_SIMAS|nr:prolyl oligopeptidase family serine peptidase [Simiduia agarivorans]AFU98200.2 prolyl oligopeptidase family protein [Simiduia agarivorans SA1 = DSM 21679]
MNEPEIRTYGSWRSPIQAHMLTQAGVRLAEPRLFKGHSYWLESRPSEQGRSVLVCDKGSGPEDINPPGVSIRSSVNEYGGGAYCLAERQGATHLFYVDAADQQVYSLNLSDHTRQAVTGQVDARYADLTYHPTLDVLIAVEETGAQSNAESIHRLVALRPDTRYRQILAEGCDFFASPAISPDGTALCWLSWNHPHMPWDQNQCWLSSIDANGLRDVRPINPPNSSSFQPAWSPNGRLLVVNDASGWWNLCEWNGREWHNILPMEAEFALPQWQFGMACYGFLDENTLLTFYTRDGLWHAGTLGLENRHWQPQDWPFSSLSALACEHGQALFLGASAHQAEAVIRWRGKDFASLKTSIAQHIDHSYIAAPKAIAFDTSDNCQAYGFYYPPTNPAYRAPEQNLPPLIVLSHGGPTGATDASLNIKIQFWTSRGFAVMDVNYRGSTGFGTAYRQQLNGHWGIRDVDDLCYAARYAVEQGWADPDKLIVKGSSAGGYSVLAALAFRDTFCAGTSLYGIGDLTALATDTHKFESRYLDGLVAPWPAGRTTYLERSPLTCPENIRCPVIFFQGLKDKVVPPNQARAMHSALANQGITTALVTFENEAHGFRQAEAIIDQLELELTFYGRLFGFEVYPNRQDLDDYLSNP